MRYIALLVLCVCASAQFKPAIRGLDRAGGATGPAGPPGPSTTPAGGSGEIQFNNAGAFGSNGNFKVFSGTGNVVVGATSDDGANKFQVVGGNLRLYRADDHPVSIIEATTGNHWPTFRLKVPTHDWTIGHGPTEVGDPYGNSLFIQDTGAAVVFLIRDTAHGNRISYGAGADDGVHQHQFTGTTSYTTYSDQTLITAPAAPSSSSVLRVYAKSGTTPGICWKDSTNTETCAGAAGTGGGGTGAIQIQADNVNVGAATTQIDFQSGDNISVALNNTGSEVTAQINAGTGLLRTLDAVAASYQKCYSTSAANTYLSTMLYTISSTQLVDGMKCTFKATNANTGAATLNIDGTGAKPVVKADGTAVASGNIAANTYYTLTYDGANFRMPAGGAGGVTTTSASIPMPVGGCLQSGAGVYWSWGVVGGGITGVCLDPALSLAAIQWDASTTSYAQYWIRLPQDWNGGNVSFVFDTTNASGGSGQVKFNVTPICLPSGTGTGSPVYGTGGSVTYTAGGTNVMIEHIVASLAFAGSCTVGTPAFVQVTRDIAVSGNMAAAETMVTPELRYTRQ